MRRLLAGGLLAALLGGALVWQHLRQQPPGPAFDGPRPLNVILFVIDTLRSDRLLDRQGGPAAMPGLHAFARRGVSFPNAVAPAPWTLPSMASLLTGVMPSEHRVELMPEGPARLGPVGTWAQAFAARGYQVAAYTGGPWSWSVPDSLLKGFPRSDPPSVTAFHLAQPFARLDTWRRGLDPRRPFFLVLHSFEAHDPYGAAEHPAPGQRPLPPAAGFDPGRVTEPWERARRFLLSRSERDALQARWGNAFMDDVVRYLWSGYRAEPRPELAAELAAAYTQGARWVDGLASDVLAWLERGGLLADSVLILTSDHGEAFGEHGFLEHGRQAYDEVVRVPLVLVGPSLPAGRVVTSNVSLMDAVPTAVELTGGSLPPGVTGRSLMPVIRGEEGGRVARVEERVNRTVTAEDVDLTIRALRSDRWKVIATWDHRTGAVTWEAYDLLEDPEERRNRSGADGPAGLALEPELVAAVERLRQELGGAGARPPGPP